MDSRAALILAAALAAGCGGSGPAPDSARAATTPVPGATTPAPAATTTALPAAASDSPRADGHTALVDSAVASDSARALVFPRDTLPTMLRDDSAAGPRLVGSGPEKRLQLPSRLMDVLRAEQPGFETLRRADFAPDSREPVAGIDSASAVPFAVIGDFDGDGRPDVAMLGHVGSSRRIVVILDRRAAPRVMSIAEDHGTEPDSLGVHETLGLARPGETMFEDDEGHRIRLKHEAIVLESEGAYELWYYLNGQFLYAAIGD